MIAYTTGYLGTRTNKGDAKAARLAQLVQDLDLVLTDIRAVAWSQAPCWRKAALQDLLGDRYVHIPELGNSTRRTGTITIVDLAVGLEKALALLRPPLLLCCCPLVEDCHRYVVARALNDRPEVERVEEIEHWGPLRR